MYQAVQIFQKLKLFNNLKKKIIIIQFNIMIVDIDKKNNLIKLMNILQLKWILYIQIQKRYYNNKLIHKIIEITKVKIIKLIM